LLDKDFILNYTLYGEVIKEEKSMPLERQIWDVMDNRFTKVTPETPLKEACAIMTGFHRTKPAGPGLVVMRANGEYLGVLSVNDILRYLNFMYDQALREKENWLDRLMDRCADESLVSVNDVMTRFDISIRPNQKIIEAIRIMLEEDVDLLPVEDAGKIIGVLYGETILGEIARLMYKNPNYSE
jgi:CBS domain-containing protein